MSSRKPAIVINKPATAIINCHRFRKKSRCQSIECKIDLLKLPDVLLRRLNDVFLTSYQSYSVAVSSKKLYNFFSIRTVKYNATETYKLNISDQDWDDDSTFFKVSRDLTITLKQPQIFPYLLNSRTKKLRPKKLVLQNCEIPWDFVKEIAVETVHLELENSVISELPKLKELFQFFNYATTLLLPSQLIEHSRFWLNFIANWYNSQPNINIDITVTGIDFNFDIEKLHRFFKNRTSCIIKTTVILPNETPFTQVHQAIDNHFSTKFMQVKYNQIPTHYLKLSLKLGLDIFEIEYIPRC